MVDKNEIRRRLKRRIGPSPEVQIPRPPLCPYGCGPMRKVQGEYECISDHK